MKRLTNNMTTAAAVLMITAGVASAQTVLKAEVPFAFHVGNRVMEPGTIRIHQLKGNNSNMAVIVTNSAAKRSYIVLPKSVGDAPKKWIASGDPKLGFDCSTGACVLAQAWAGEGSAYKFYGPRVKSGEMQLTEIVMKADKGD
jgi:hypothetical protein